MGKLAIEQELLLQLLAGGQLKLPDDFNATIFQALLKRHKLFPLSEQVLPLLPESLRHTWKGELKHWTAQSLLIYRELVRIQSLIRSNGGNILSVKGPLLSFQLYQSFHQRYYTDLDIIMSEHEVQKTVSLLEENDYSLRTPAKQLSGKEWDQYLRYNNDVILVNKNTGIPIEIHLGIYVEQLLDHKVQEEMLKHTLEIDIHGNTFTTLSPEYNFLYLCFHAAKHMYFRLCWLRDIGVFIEKTEMDHEKIVRLAKEFGLEKSLALSLLLVKEYFPPQQFPEAFNLFIEKKPFPLLQRLARSIILGPGELVYEDYRRFRKAENQIEGINKVRFRHLINQVLFLILLRKGLKKRIRFLFYQLRKRS